MSDAPRPIRPRVDDTLGDTEALIDLGLAEPDVPPGPGPGTEPPVDETDPPAEEPTA